MSRVYWHSPSAEAELWGGERAWLSGLVSDIAIGVLDPFYSADTLSELITAQCDKPPARGERITWASRFGTSLSVGFSENLLTWKGRQLDALSLQLNTALRVGNDAVRLAARIHGQCEIHCWFEGKDRGWIAGIITEGLAGGVFRKGISDQFGGASRDIGWEDVRAMLLDSDEEPVVLSYSVCEQFPDPYVIGWQPPADDCERPHDDTSEQWYELSSEERWRLGMTWLREQRGGLQIKPENFSTYTFRHGLSAFDIKAPDWRERLDKALLDA
jgi:hypothetical protein